MKISNVKVDDIVRVEAHGDRFWGIVLERPAKGQLRVDYLRPGFSPTTISSREVIGHWRQSKGSRR